jgi:hypothetical protein
VAGERRSSSMSQSYDANFKEYLAQMREAIDNDEKTIAENKGYFPEILNTGAAEALKTDDTEISPLRIKEQESAVKI